MSRKITNRLFELLDEGVLDPQFLIACCLNYMSESDIEDMARINEMLPDEDGVE